MHEAYAQALWQMIKKGKSPHETVAVLKKNLEKTGREALLPKIARAFERLAAKDAKKNTMTLTVARHKDAAHAIRQVKEILLHEGIKETDLQEKVDENLIGGWRLEGKGILVDKSWKNSLLSIYNRSTT